MKRHYTDCRVIATSGEFILESPIGGGGGRMLVGGGARGRVGRGGGGLHETALHRL